MHVQNIGYFITTNQITQLPKKVGMPLLFYSQTGCSLASNIAILRCNVAILMCKLLGANCNRFDKLLLKRYSSFLYLLQN